MSPASDVKTLFTAVVRSKTLHARWLNTFSYLEYIGFRKIVKSQTAEWMSAETLSHAVEEGRHALRLKRLALKVGGARFDDYAEENLLCGRAAEAYFQNLDHRCFESFPAEMNEARRTRLTYLYVTWLVEVRALEVYELYHEALHAIGEAPALQALLKEEEGHLRCVENELRERDPEFEARQTVLKEIEAQLYQQYLMNLRTELSHVDEHRV